MRGAEIVAALRAGARNLTPEEVRMLDDALGPQEIEILGKMLGPEVRDFLMPIYGRQGGGVPAAPPQGRGLLSGGGA